jgi:L-histidine N-alpha-methyltransferase
MIARELIVPPQFAPEVEQGLIGFPKTLPSKLFYDEGGSALFEEITRLPEYYLTRTELRILRERAGEIAQAVEPGVTVVELGSGTAAKTCTLLEALGRRQIRVPYYPVDISPAALNEARDRVETQCPNVYVHPVPKDFSEGFGFLRDIPGRKLVLYLGSSIGNFDPDAAIEMLSSVRTRLAPGDALLLGTDLVKEASILVPAYDDERGVTAEFNKNILRRLNRELGANFDLDLFRHIALWNPDQSRMEIYLESLRAQTINIGLLRLRVRFALGERIHTENSYKYTMPMVGAMLSSGGFALDQSWFDKRKWFALHLARV